MAAVGNNNAPKKPRDPDGLFYKGEKMYLIDRRFSTTAYGDDRILIKLLFPYGPEQRDIDDLKVSGDHECELQRRAAEKNVGPQIYANGMYYGNGAIPFTGYIETDEDNDKGDSVLEEFAFTTPFYYIVMEYYSRETGWKGPVYVSDPPIHPGIDNNDLFYTFIKKLVTKARVANVLDPIMHFYYHPRHGLRMIDYGRGIRCSTNDCIAEMCRLVQVRMPSNTKRSSSRRGRNRNRPNNTNKNNRRRNRSASRIGQEPRTLRSSSRSSNRRKP